jgi:alpha-beta hydrolase superfamily lysophospholipase
MTELHHLLRIVGSRGQRIAAVLQRASSEPAPRPLVVIAPAFEHSIRNSFVIARYLLAQGFDVLRYDACNHVGLSDGSILDFTLDSALTDLCDVVRFARRDLGASCVSLVATSLAGRVALRAASQLAGELACIGSIACVVDVRGTVGAAAALDCVGEWLDGRVRDPERTWKVVKNHVKYAFCRDAIASGWHTLASTLKDSVAAKAIPFFDVHGEHDPWVETADVLALAASSPSVEVVVLRDAVHELNAATSRLALCHLVQNVVAHAQGRKLEIAEIHELRWAELVAFNKRERVWERTPVEEWELYARGVAGREARGDGPTLAIKEQDRA